MAYGKANIDTIQSSTAGTPPQFNDGNGTQTGTLCRAWVNFNGTGTVAIRASFNVSSITDNGTGDYTVNFTNAMTDANYSFSGQMSYDISGGTPTNYTALTVKQGSGGSTTTTCRVRTAYATTSGGSLVDPEIVNLAFFR